MGFRFRYRVPLAKGVHLNLSKKGISSLSLGIPGMTGNIGRNGLKGTVGIPGTGLSYSEYAAYKKSKTRSTANQTQQSECHSDYEFAVKVKNNVLTQCDLDVMTQNNEYTELPFLARHDWTPAMEGAEIKED